MSRTNIRGAVEILGSLVPTPSEWEEGVWVDPTELLTPQMRLALERRHKLLEMGETDEDF